MNQTLVVRLLFAAGCILLAAVNFTVLSRVHANRQGQPDARLWLTEREAPKISRLGQENNGVALRLTWRTLSREENEYEDRRPSWLSGQKLEELGFHFADALETDQRPVRSVLAREVFIVLEYNGGAYHNAVRRAERALEKQEEALRANSADKGLQSARQQAKKRLRNEEISESRLFAVDAGLDPQHLRASYDDGSRFIIAPGVVNLTYRTENGRAWATGQIEHISVDTVHLPLEQRRALDAILQRNKSSQGDGKPPRYQVELLYGSSREPRIGAVRPLEEP